MSDYISSFPEIPDNFGTYNDYLILRDTKRNTYLLLAFDSNEKNTIVGKSGTLSSVRGLHYKYDPESEYGWVADGKCLGSHPFNSSNYEPVYSTADLYNSDGGLVFSGTAYTSPVTVYGGLSSSNLLFSALADVRTVLPVLAVAFVFVIGFRRTWDFLKDTIRGV